MRIFWKCRSTVSLKWQNIPTIAWPRTDNVSFTVWGPTLQKGCDCGLSGHFEKCHLISRCVFHFVVNQNNDKLLIYHYDVIKWKHFPRYWPFVRGIHRRPVNSPHKSQWHGVLMLSLIYAWINGWANNRKAGDLRLHRAHYDVTMIFLLSRRVKMAGIHRHSGDALRDPQIYRTEPWMGGRFKPKYHASKFRKVSTFDFFHLCPVSCYGAVDKMGDCLVIMYSPIPNNYLPSFANLGVIYINIFTGRQL